ncbi:MAG: zinc finger Ran-binding domain-containing protein [Cytophagales bacterium]|nr:zinc finger Ran-binding domain-containing protein [Bernardetiaceae bacterium]MDW8210147.1 zinc finger Ran-binding domain-containing protein [Cytophagales bacterium]
MAIRMGRWDCPVCGLKGNPGPETHCAGCGAPRSKEVEFYLPDDAEEVTQADKLRQAKAGADWHCDYCGADNKATEEFCKSCGNQRTDQDVARQEKVIYYQSSSSTVSSVPEESQRANPADNKARDRRKYWLVVSAFAIVVATGLWVMLRPQKFEVQVVEHQWERTVDIEENRLFTEESWELPVNANLIAQWQAVHHYDQVIVGYQTKTRTVRVQTGTKRVKCGKKNLGNGYFEDLYCDQPVYENRTETYQEPIYRQVPVYKTRYKYQIYRWTVDHTAKASGNDKKPYFPQETLPGSNWRQGKRTEVYRLVLKDKKGKEYHQEVSFQFWQSKSVGDWLPAKRNALGNFYGLVEK